MHDINTVRTCNADEYRLERSKGDGDILSTGVTELSDDQLSNVNGGTLPQALPGAHHLLTYFDEPAKADG